MFAITQAASSVHPVAPSPYVLFHCPFVAPVIDNEPLPDVAASGSSLVRLFAGSSVSSHAARVSISPAALTLTGAPMIPNIIASDKTHAHILRYNMFLVLFLPIFFLLKFIVHNLLLSTSVILFFSYRSSYAPLYLLLDKLLLF